MPIFLNGKFSAGVAFLSKSKSTYSLRDVQAGRRIADRLAVSLERDHVAEAAKRADEANARAAQLESRVRQLTDELDARTGYRRVIGESLPWREVLKKAAQVAAVETTVLLLGESGTGKEVVARFIHRGSARRDGPFVALNCAALPDNLLESELFGYERGAFTGAVQSKPGLIEQAAGGVLFLDEVGEMALSAQAKFLRVLQEREFQRLGGTRVLKADVRVVAATNRDLRKAIEQKLFREDLYFHALADDSAMFLDRKSPAYMGACTRFLLNDSLRQRFLELSDAVRYGGTSDRMALEPEFSVWVDFARSMAPMMMMASQELSKLVIESDTSSLKVLDIAAGHGLFGIAVLRANPNAMVTAVDWKNVLEVARENAEKFGVAERYRTLPGSIFDVDIDPDTISC
jgi:hypothetical protein